MNSELTFFDVLERGGWAMVPLLLCSVVAVAVVLERVFWGMRRSRVFPGQVAAGVDSLLAAGKVEELADMCAGSRSPLGRIVLTGIRNAHRPREEIVEVLELAGRREYSNLQRYVGILGTIAAIAPLLGLFGTVIGIIRTFSLIEQHGIGNPQVLAGGISQALVATASGISIAVPAMVFYRYLLARGRHMTLELEEFTLELLNRVSSSGVTFERVKHLRDA